MKILLTADPEIRVPPELYGGIERVVDLLVREFTREGHQVTLVARAGSTSPATTKYAWVVDSSRGLWAAVRNSFVLRRAVSQVSPDVIHSFSRLLWLSPMFRDPMPRIMSYQREPSGRTVRLAARLHGDRLQFSGCSEYIAANGRRRGGGRWSVVPNCVDPQVYRFVGNVPANAPLVFLSRVEEIKGCHSAIEIAKASGRRLLIAGNHETDGENGVYWSNRVAPELGRNGIEYVGPVNDSQKSSLLGSAAALVVPIEWHEPFGIVFIEALACGTPVISAPLGALPEIIEDGEHGFLVHSVEGGLEAVRRLPTVDRAVCRRLVETKFSMKVVANQYLSLYADAVARRRPDDEA